MTGVDQAVFHFHDELNDLLPRRLRGKPVRHAFDWRASIKDMVESLGVPHTEIELIVAGGSAVGFDYIVQPEDDIHVYPRFDAVTAPGAVRLRPPQPAPPRFVLDVHLGRLAAYLRMLGFDAVYGDTNNHAVDFDDAALAAIAHDEQRILLTHDIGLLKRSIVIYGYWLRSMEPRHQLEEVMRRFDLRRYVEPFRRCLKCNGLLVPVDKQQVLDRLQPDTARYVDEFHQCQQCGQVYWKGVHTDRMQKLIDEVLDGGVSPADGLANF
jgi:hypothetical protein